MELQEALSVALDFERKVRDHYAQSARRTQDPQGHKVFATLAREEQGHVDYLESRLAEWRARGEITAAPLTTVLPPVAWIQAEAGKAAARTGASQRPAGALPEMDFLKEALELEHKTSGFYRSLVAQLASSHRELFARFLEIEDGHVLIVQAEIDALAGHGHWFDFMEFSLEQ